MKSLSGGIYGVRNLGMGPDLGDDKPRAFLIGY